MAPGRTKGKKRQNKRISGSDLDSFKIDWDLIQKERISVGGDITIVDNSLTENIADDDTTENEQRVYDFTTDEKFDFFVEVMADDNSCNSTGSISTATILEEYHREDRSITQDTSLTQDMSLVQDSTS